VTYFARAEQPEGAGFHLVAWPATWVAAATNGDGEGTGDPGRMHLHAGEEIIRVVSGEAIIRVGDERQICRAGDIAVVPAETVTQAVANAP